MEQLAVTPEEPEVPAVPVTVVARMMGGEAHSTSLTLQHTVGELKAALATHGVSPDRQKLFFCELELQDGMVLGMVDGFVAAMDSSAGDCDGSASGTEKSVEVTMVVLAPLPPLAVELGLGREHPSILRAYFEKHGLEEPEWLALDDEVWGQLQKAHDEKKAIRSTLGAWSHLVKLSVGDEATGILHAKPGEKLSLTVSGFVHNKNGDSCIHQVILAADTQVLGEIYDGVPGRGRHINKTMRIQAPEQPGTYMIWRANDLQYSMRDALNNFRTRHGERVANRYPGTFSGWLVVTAPEETA